MSLHDVGRTAGAFSDAELVMAVEPYPEAKAGLGNPSVFCSRDGTHWNVHAGARSQFSRIKTPKVRFGASFYCEPMEAPSLRVARLYDRPIGFWGLRRWAAGYREHPWGGVRYTPLDHLGIRTGGGDIPCYPARPIGALRAAFRVVG